MLTVPTSKSWPMAHALLLETKDIDATHFLRAILNQKNKTKDRKIEEGRSMFCLFRPHFFHIFHIDHRRIHKLWNPERHSERKSLCRDVPQLSIPRTINGAEKEINFTSTKHKTKKKNQKRWKRHSFFHYILLTCSWPLFTVYIAIVGGKSLSRIV